jgi:four helix bundle protein
MTREYNDRNLDNDLDREPGDQADDETREEMRDEDEEQDEEGGGGGEGDEEGGGGGGGGGGGRGDRGGRRGGRGGGGGGGGPRDRIDSFEKMKVWQEAHSLTMRVFENTPKLPSDQQGGLALQMEAAAVSVPKSIAEGFKRRGPRNKAHFYNIAQSALEGLRYYFILCRDLKYDIDYEDLSYRGDQVARMLDGLIRSMLR